MVTPRKPGVTNLQHSLERADLAIFAAYRQPERDAPLDSSRVSQALREEFIERQDRLLDAIRNPPAWRDFPLSKKASISVQTGTGFRWLFGWTNFAQDQVEFTDPGILTWVNEGWDQTAGWSYEDEGPAPPPETDYLCVDSSKQFVGMTEPCEVAFQSDCFTIARPETRGKSLVPIEKQFYRLFGCQDYFYTLDILAEQLSETIAKVDAALGTVDTGQVTAGELLNSTNDEVNTTSEALQDIKPTVFPTWLFLGGAALAFVWFKK